MAKIRELDEAAWAEWVASRPPAIRALCERIRPDTLYRMTSTGQRVYVHSYDEMEDGTVALKVVVDGRFNRVMFSRAVFGISPDDLTECDLPGPDEDVGDTQEELGISDEDMKRVVFPRLREQMRDDPEPRP